MPSPIFRYPLDLTGVNSNNLVTDELHNLPNLAKRAVIPTYAPFFTESITVRDGATTLVRGTHYECMQLVEEATIKTGKEICEVILILDPTVSSQVTITYQTIGGLYQRTSDAIVDMYNTVINDNRPVDWVNVLNKPIAYPPSLHNHLFQDVVGFEPLIVELERIRHAVTLSNVPAIEALIDWFSKRAVKEVIMIKPDRFTVSRGGSITFNLESVNIEAPYNYYWTVEHIDTTNDDFVATSGVVNLKTGFNSFNLLTRIPLLDKLPGEFKINIRRDSTAGAVIFKSGVITLRPYKVADYLDLLYYPKCIFTPGLEITPETMFIAGSKGC